ncbi:MAG: hypothetical protein IT377_11945 [Polyangiaceae bacterium]|nr:hypothetical protein [Polyangiaceae bacterium]
METSIERKPIVINGQGLIGSWISLGAIFAERSVAVAFGVSKDSQVELSSVLEGALELADTSQQSTLRVLKKSLRRLTTYGLDLTEIGEQAALAVVHTVRGTGHDAIDFASRTASALATPVRPQPHGVS